MLRWESLLFGSVSSRGRPLPSTPPATTGATPVPAPPLRDSTGAPPSSGIGVELQPRIRADSRAGMSSLFMKFSGEDYLKNGPQAGSRTSPAATERRCLILPSLETADITPRPPISVAIRIMRLLGAKLGDSSLLESVRIWIWRLARSIAASWKRPSRRVMKARLLPSADGRGETL